MVGALYFQLRRRGALVWLDMYEQDLSEAGMKKGVDASDVLVVFLTSSVLTRPFCLQGGGARLRCEPLSLARSLFVARAHTHITLHKMSFVICLCV